MYLIKTNWFENGKELFESRKSAETPSEFLKSFENMVYCNAMLILDNMIIGKCRIRKNFCVFVTQNTDGEQEFFKFPTKEFLGALVSGMPLTRLKALEQVS